MSNASLHLSNRRLSRAVGRECERLGFEVSYDGSSVTLNQGPFAKYPIAELPLIVAEELVQKGSNATIADAVELAGRIDPMLQPADSYTDLPEDYPTAPASGEGWRLSKAVGATALLVGTAFAGYALAKELMPEIPSIVMDADATHVNGEIHEYQDAVSNLIKFKTDVASAIGDASLTEAEVPTLHSDIFSANLSLSQIYQSVNASGFNETAKKIRGNMEVLQTPQGGVPLLVETSSERISAFQSLKTTQWPKVNQTLDSWKITNHGIESFFYPDNSTPAGKLMSDLLTLTKDDYLFYRQVEQTQKTITGISDLGKDETFTEKPVKEFLEKLLDNTKEMVKWLDPSDKTPRQASSQNGKYFSIFNGEFLDSSAQVLNSAIPLINEPDENVPYFEIDITPPVIDSVEAQASVEAGTPWDIKIFAHDPGPADTRGVDRFDLTINRPDAIAEGIKLNATGLFSYTPDIEGNYRYFIYAHDRMQNKNIEPFEGNFSAWKDKVAPKITVSDYRKSLFENDNLTINFTAADQPPNPTGIKEVKAFFNNTYFNATPAGGVNYQLKLPVGAPGNKTARIFATDNRDNSANVSLNFSVLETPDTKPPKIFEMQGVSEGQVFAPGNITISVLARDNIIDNQKGNKKLDRVEFILDGQVYQGSDRIYDCTFNICNEIWPFKTTVDDGKHTISARAYDLAGNVGEYNSINFTVQKTTPNPDNRNVRLNEPNPWPFVALAGGAAVLGGLYAGMRDGVKIERVIYVKKDGRPIIRKAWTRTSGETDEDIEAGMLSAVGTFIRDATGGSTRKHQISVSGHLYNMLFAYGDDSVLVANVSGNDGENVVRRMERFIYPLEEAFRPQEWGGEISPTRTAPAVPFLEKVRSPPLSDRFAIFVDKALRRSSYRKKPVGAYQTLPPTPPPQPPAQVFAQQPPPAPPPALPFVQPPPATPFVPPPTPPLSQTRAGVIRVTPDGAPILTPRRNRGADPLAAAGINVADILRENRQLKEENRQLKERVEALGEKEKAGTITPGERVELERTRSLLEKLSESEMGAGDTEGENLRR